MSRTASLRWWTLGAIALAILAVTLDVTVLTLALPTLAGALKATESDLQWFVTAYTLALVAGMLPAGLVADRYGRKALMAAALVAFCLGSLGCAHATGPGLFIIARVVVGLAGAAMIVVALSLLTVLFDEKERPRAVGIWGAANFIGLPLGPILGGWILGHFWWGWIFLMNVPVALIGLGAVLFLVPESRAARAPRVDAAALILSSAALVAVMYGLIEAGAGSWHSLSALAPIAAGLVLLYLFVAWERRLGRTDGEPLVDLGLFASRNFSWGVALTAFGALALFGVLFALPQYFEAVRGLGPQAAGVRLLPPIAGLVAGALPADRIASRVGAKLTVGAGFAIAAVGMALGTSMTPATGIDGVMLWTFLTGLGAGVGFATAASTAVVELTADRAGIGAALLQAVVKLGPAIGAAVLGSVLNSAYQARLATSGLAPAAAAAARESVFGALDVARVVHSAALAASARAAFVGAMDSAVLVGCAITVAATLLCLLFLPGKAAARGAERESTA